MGDFIRTTYGEDQADCREGAGTQTAFSTAERAVFCYSCIVNVTPEKYMSCLANIHLPWHYPRTFTGVTTSYCADSIQLPVVKSRPRTSTLSL